MSRRHIDILYSFLELLCIYLSFNSQHITLFSPQDYRDKSDILILLCFLDLYHIYYH